ncbi:diacylglyceryl transferase [Bacillus sp. DX1.1]|uniref:diacylglyceryl transferase n=1 Tax=unclassified Bacillus (in: firmicutes) TaxID=185979 RepID=UPI0025705B5E|nr:MULTISPECIES: diacylglyceryl transferase [unclassified Bacillus (in: firmicutes)]MDM5154302.1 diacylglyceryl transferase [Bacillus sp. DX1.1]WJE84032.1 diacylglyceryl transferase [Bacillus sp. DX3.1]
MMEWMMKIQPISPILGSLLGLILMKLKLKKQCIPHETMMDVVTNGFMIIVVTWKFAPAILNPGWTIQSPLQALLTAGDVKHIVIGSLIASGYVVWKSKKADFSIRVLLDILPFGIVSILILYSLFHSQFGTRTTMPWGMRIYDSKFLYHPIYIYEIIIAIFMLGWLWKQKDVLGSGKYISYFLIAEGIVHIFISLISEQIPFLLGLSLQQLFIFIVISTGIVLFPKK